MFILFPSGGLGNQLFMVASIYSFARSTGQPWFVNGSKHSLVQGNTIDSYLDNIFWQIPIQDKSRLLINLSKNLDLGYHAEIIYDYPDRYSYFNLDPNNKKTLWSLLDSHMFNANYFYHYREEMGALFSLPRKEEEELAKLVQKYINPLPLKKVALTLERDKVKLKPDFNIDLINSNFPNLDSENLDVQSLNKKESPVNTLDKNTKVNTEVYSQELDKSNISKIDFTSLAAEQERQRLELIKSSNLLPTVSLHVRRGDYLRFSDIYHLMTEKYYAIAQEALYSTQGKHLASGAKLVVFSDDIEWCKTSLPQAEWVKEVVYIPNDVKDYQALLLMAQCDFHIIGNSSFSWWGAFLDPYRGKTVAPYSWFKVNSQTNDFINLKTMTFVDNRKL